MTIEQARQIVDNPAMPTLVALCPVCGCLLACAVQEPESAKANAKAVVGWVMDGLTVKTIPVSEVRVSKWCHCPREKKKGERAA